jgi:diaminopimelate epimerase
MMNINFTKMQSAGNDFILIEEKEAINNYSSFARFACDRHFGIGADGVLVLTKALKADAGMKMFNPDGSEAEACGNGLRCLAKYCFDNGFAKGGVLAIETLAGVHFPISSNKWFSLHNTITTLRIFPVLVHLPWRAA